LNDGVILGDNICAMPALTTIVKKNFYQYFTTVLPQKSLKSPQY